MPISQEELLFLQSQLEGLESIFLELIPCGIELKRQQVQDYYLKRYDQAVRPTTNVAEAELKRQFNTKANNVRNLVDSAESLGDAGNKVNLIKAAATLPDERNKPLKANVGKFCKELIYENSLDTPTWQNILSSSEIGHIEARVLLGSVMFLMTDEIDSYGEKMKVHDLLAQLIKFIASKSLLARNDPFLVEAQCFLEAMMEDSK